MTRSKFLPLGVAAALYIWPLAPNLTISLISAAQASEDNLTNSEKADKLRRKSRRKADSRLGYPDVEPDYIGGYYGLSDAEERELLDEEALSEQIARLAATVRALRKRARMLPPQVPSLAPPAPRASNNLQAIYGPKGPTVKSVRLILEYRLMIIDNPRLMIGKVSENATNVVAHVVTVDGSLVDKFTVDKATGAWVTIR